MSELHVSSLATQFRPQRLRYDTFFFSRFLCSKLQKQARTWICDTLAVRIVRWLTIFRPTRGSQQRFVNTQTKMLPGYPCALFVKSNPLRGALFPSTNQNQVESCLLNFKKRLRSWLDKTHRSVE